MHNDCLISPPLSSSSAREGSSPSKLEGVAGGRGRVSSTMAVSHTPPSRSDTSPNLGEDKRLSPSCRDAACHVRVERVAVRPEEREGRGEGRGLEQPCRDGTPVPSLQGEVIFATTHCADGKGVPSLQKKKHKDLCPYVLLSEKSSLK